MPQTSHQTTTSPTPTLALAATVTGCRNFNGRYLYSQPLVQTLLSRTVGRSAAAAGARGLPECPGQDQRRLHSLPRSLPYDDIWDPVLRIIDAFGIDRCMWGTDWTRTSSMLTYEQGVAPFRNTDRLSDTDRSKLMGGTLQKVYRW